MKQRLADYVADFLAAHGVTDVFSVVGGGAMHLNDALGHHPALHVTYNHHEQASAIAAEAYARIDNKIAALCVTTGPGGTNALTGVVGGWLDSIPMFVISGQVRYDTTARYAAQFTDGLPLRAVGDQEYDITKSVAPMTKYATMLEDPNQIRYVLEKAWHLATTGRPGPVWIDIPVNYQGGYIETDSLPGYDPAQDDARLPPPVDDATVQMVLEKIRHAKRPVFHAGYGIRLSGGYAAFRAVAEKLNETFRASGLYLTVRALPLKQYKSALSNGNFDLYLGEVRLTANFDLSEFFSSEGNLNYGGISDTELARLCIASLENSGNYADLCARILGTAPICPVAFKSYAIYVTRGKLASITPAVDYLFHNAVTARTLADADRSYDRAEPGGNSGESSEPTDTSAKLSEP